MKTAALCFLMMSMVHGLWAQKFLSDTSYIKFYSEAPIEDIEAYNTKGNSVVDVSSGQLVFSIPITGFTFEKSLMQEHFNENYLESEKYPKSTFSGKIIDWNGQQGKQTVTASGELTIHGRKQQIAIKGEIFVSDEKVEINAVFPIELVDYKIKIPKAVFYNIAEVVEVTIYFRYAPYNTN
jgi:hypothetical protein